MYPSVYSERSEPSIFTTRPWSTVTSSAQRSGQSSGQTEGRISIGSNIPETRSIVVPECEVQSPPMAENPTSKARVSDILAALTTPIGFTGLYIFVSYLLPEIGCPVFLTVDRREPCAIGFFGAFALWLDAELIRKYFPDWWGAVRGRPIPIKILWVLGQLVLLVTLGYLLFLVVVLPGVVVFGILSGLAKEATSRPDYFHRVMCDVLFLAALGLAVPGLLPLARRVGLAPGDPAGSSKRWTAYAAVIACGVLVIALVALIGRMNPMAFRRIFLPPVEG